MMTQPLRMRRDYGEEASAGVNQYLNTPPTKLKRDIEKEKDPKKKKEMKDSLEAWRTVVPGPFWRSAVAKELIKIAKILTQEEK